MFYAIRVGPEGLTVELRKEAKAGIINELISVACHLADKPGLKGEILALLVGKADYESEAQND
jgi:hypothetical protein